MNLDLLINIKKNQKKRNKIYLYIKYKLYLQSNKFIRKGRISQRFPAKFANIKMDRNVREF